MNESEQAQKNEKLLAENNVLAILVDELKADREAQAVKIKEQAKTIEINAAYAIELQGKLSEQAKELAEARAIADAHRDTVMMYKFGNQPQRYDFPDESRIRNPWDAHA